MAELTLWIDPAVLSMKAGCHFSSTEKVEKLARVKPAAKGC